MLPRPLVFILKIFAIVASLIVLLIQAVIFIWVYNHNLAPVARLQYSVDIGDSFNDVNATMMSFYEHNKHWMDKSDYGFHYGDNMGNGDHFWEKFKYFHVTQEAILETHPVEIIVSFDKNDKVEHILFSAD